MGLTLTLWKAKLDIFLYEFRQARLRRKYCRRGYHKLRTGMYAIKLGDNREKRVRFLRCEHCKYVFFANRHAMKRYQELQESNIKAMRKIATHMAGGQ